MKKPRLKTNDRILTKDQAIAADAERGAVAWWASEGRYIDPDTDEVDWFDKRGDLAHMAFVAGYKAAKSESAG
jgi:hypothetical protein